MPRLLTIGAALIAFLFLLLGYVRPITAYNQDLGRHLLTGKLILQTFTVPSTNLFSYTYPNFPFINHHWFSEVIFYSISTLLGNGGLFFLSLILVTGACGLIYWQAGRQGAKPITLLLLSLIYLRVLFERTDLRPELFSFLFLAAMVTLLYQYREKYTRLIFLLIPIQLLWSNIHIYFPIGILVTILFLIDAGITHRKKLIHKQTKTLVYVLLGMGCITLLNPHGLTGALYPLHVFQNYGYTIEENQNPFFLQSLGFHKASLPYLELAVVICLISFCCNLKKTRFIDWLLLVVFTAVAFNAVRNFPLFVFTTFIPVSRSLSLLSSSLSQKLEVKKHPIISILTVIGLSALFFWQGKAILATHPLQYAIYEDGEGALDFFHKNHLKGPLFNNFDIGSYIEYRLYPQEKVFIDGRPEAYPASFIQNTYMKMQQDPAFFKTVADTYRFNTIVFSHTDQTPWAEAFLDSITHNPLWKTVYLDSSMIILVKDTEENKLLTTKYASVTKNMTIENSPNSRQLRQAAHFYSITNNTPQLKNILVQLLTEEPADCGVMNVLLSIYSQENNPAAQIYSQRYQSLCSP